MPQGYQRQADGGRVIQVSVSVVSADGKQKIPFAEFLDPPVATELESFVANSVPELDSADLVGCIQVQVLVTPVAATENELFKVAHGLHRVRRKAMRRRHLQ